MKHTSHTVVDWTHYLTHAEVDTLQDLARSLPEGAMIVNIGAGNGTSGLAFMEARDDLRLFTIDIQRESSPFGCLEGEEAVFKSAGFWGDPRHTQIHGDSKTVEWPHGLVDFVFVDGGHQEHEAKGDIIVWLPRIKPGGLMAVHDFEKTAKVWIGVDKAVRDLLLGHFEEVVRIDTLIVFRVSEQPAQKATEERKPLPGKPGRPKKAGR